jgi:serine/threonine protein kinase
MTLHTNNELLKSTLEALPLLDGRFEKLKLVNVPLTGPKRGCFSLVFKAWDTVDQKYVALKFYDIDPAILNDQYRMACFKREHVILQQLLGVDRCLQLASSLSRFELNVPLDPNTGSYFVVHCDYFAVDWLPDQIDGYFLNQQNHEALEKLKIFNEITLAVEVLHSRGVFHRDLKSDNLRSYLSDVKRLVVAIDLGTAARLESLPLAQGYSCSVGAPAYASPEALSSLAGFRPIARMTDAYALGCLLFELFHKDHYFVAARIRNPNLDTRIAAMQQKLMGVQSDNDRMAAWDLGLDKLAPGVASPTVESVGSSCPPGICQIIDDVVFGLTRFDYRQRMPIAKARERIHVGMRVLLNEAEYAARLRDRKLLRKKRLEKMDQRQMRLANAKKQAKVS